jgi:alkylhydroperoxidase/carboxymuconolactone decarboxylase family protein YurZ
MAEKPEKKNVTSFMRFEYVSGSLDAKTRELVLLSASAVAGCRH